MDKWTSYLPISFHHKIKDNHYKVYYRFTTRWEYAYIDITASGFKIVEQGVLYV